MSRPLAFCNGVWLPETEFSIPVYDAGFAMGVTVTEQLRTFRGKLFHLESHLVRLFRSLELVGLKPQLSSDEMQSAAQQLVAHNHPLLEEGDDLGLAMFITPGPLATLSGGRRGPPTVGMHTFALAFDFWGKKYQTGESLMETSVQQIPQDCWSPELKCRSRMHYYLADREASALSPGARAVFTDSAGNLTETATANLLAFIPETGLVTPPREKTLAGITWEITTQLAQKLNIPVIQQDLSVADAAQATEIILTSTPYCILPAVMLNGRPVGSGQPGPVYQQLLQSWNQLVGLDIEQQALQFQARG